MPMERYNPRAMKPSRARTQLTRGRPCIRCHYEYSLLSEHTSGPVCVNRTTCNRRAGEQVKRLYEFIERLRAMPPAKREMWVAAIKDEIWPNEKKRSARTS